MDGSPWVSGGPTSGKRLSDQGGADSGSGPLKRKEDARGRLWQWVQVGSR